MSRFFSEVPQTPRAVLEGPIVTIIERFPHLIKESYGDKVEGQRLEGHAWSVLRILRRVGVESEDDEEICLAAEEADRVAALISSTLTAVDTSPKAGIDELQGHHHHRLCPCQRHMELGRIALTLGKKFWVPLINGQHSGTGRSELALFRTFFPSPERPHVLFLEFEVEFQRAKQSKPGGQIPKLIVELQDEQLALEQDIEAKGIVIDESDG